MLKYIHYYIGADEFLNGKYRYCVWFGKEGGVPGSFRKDSLIKQRLENVKTYRANSKREATKELSEYPNRFGEIRQPSTDYLLIPRVSSEKRKYIPMSFFTSDIIAADSCILLPGATTYEFGILESTMHMAWTRTVCGRLKSDYRYSISIVYNNFVWPTPNAKQQTAIEKAAQAVLDTRAKYQTSTLADLYDPLAMPPDLVRAHQKLDKAVDAAYNRDFANDSERVAWLFELYQQRAGELFVETKKRGKGRATKSKKVEK
jgi:hypothetical protein